MSVNGAQQCDVIVDATIPRRSFVFGQSHSKVSAGFANVRSLAAAAFALVLLPVCPPVCLCP